MVPIICKLMLKHTVYYTGCLFDHEGDMGAGLVTDIRLLKVVFHLLFHYTVFKENIHPVD